MSGRAITFVTGEDAAAAVRTRLVEPILARWPRRSGVPQIAFTTMDRALARIAELKPGLDAQPTGPFVIVCEGNESRAQLCQVIDRLQEQLIPALLLFPTVDGRSESLETGGILVECSDTDPGLLAAMIHTLDQRQETVHSVARDLRVAQRSSGGMQGEMDKLHEEMSLANAVQRELLPRKLPQTAGMEFAATYRPMGYVSGDIYDVRQVDDDRVAFFIADAVGHGLPAALLTVALSRALTTLDRLGPAEALARLNRDLCERQHDTQRFATAVYGFVETRTGIVTLAGAGHPAPLLFTRAGVRKLETQGPLLGVFEEADFDHVTAMLDPGSTLVLYTDGLESAFPSRDKPAREYKRPTSSYLTYLSRMAQMAGTPGSSLGEAFGQFEQMLDDQAGSLHQVDDITTVAISVPAAVRAAAA